MPLPLALGAVVVSGIIAACIRILIGLGIGFVTYTVAIPAFEAFISSRFTELPPDILNMVGILRVDIAITMLFSASAARTIYKIAATRIS